MSPFANSSLTSPNEKPTANIASYHAEILDEIAGRLLHNNCNRANLIVATEPGMGKTHLLWRLMCGEAAHKYVPLFIPPINSPNGMACDVLRRAVRQMWIKDNDADKTITRMAAMAHALLSSADPEFAERKVSDYSKPSFQKHYINQRPEYLSALEKYFEGACPELQQPGDWAQALADTLCSGDDETLKYSRSWMLGEHVQYAPHAHAEPSQDEARCQMRLADLAQIAALHKPLLFIFDQIENYHTWGPASVGCFFAFIQEMLAGSVKTHVIVACNSSDWEKMLACEEHTSFKERFHDPLRMMGLTAEQAIELRDARAGDQKDVAKAKMPDKKIREICPSRNDLRNKAQVSPRAFLRLCDAAWNGKETTAPPDGKPDFAAEFEKMLGGIEREVIGFYEDSFRTFFTEILGAQEKRDSNRVYYILDGLVYFCEQDAHHKRWESLVVHALKFANGDHSRVIGVRRALCLSNHEHLAYSPVPGKWRSDHPTHEWLSRGGRLHEVTLETMRIIQASTRMMDSAADLGVTRSEIASWLRPRLSPLLPCGQTTAIAQVPEADTVEVVGGKQMIRMTVTEFVGVLMKNRPMPDPSTAFSPEDLGTHFHRLACNFVRHLVARADIKADCASEMDEFLRSDNLWNEIVPYTVGQPPSIRDALDALARNISAIRDSFPNALRWMDIYPPPHGEQSVEGVVMECFGTKVFLSGRIDILRRTRTDGSLEIVDYKLSKNPKEDLRSTQYMVQLALYAKLLSRSHPHLQFKCVLETYSPQLTTETIDSEKINDLQTRIENELQKKLSAKRAVAPPDTHGDKLPSPDSRARISDHLPKSVLEAFDGFIGNANLVERIQTALADATMNGGGKALKAGFFLSGAGGLGKTELARRIARALDIPFINLPGSSIKKVDDLLEKIDSALESQKIKPDRDGVDSGLPKFIYPPLVLFLDEVHELKKAADALLPLFEPNERRAVGSKRVAYFPDSTFIVATTDKGDLPKPFLTRFDDYHFGSYSVSEVAEILRSNKAPGDYAFRQSLARMSRLNPRIAKSRLDEFMKFHRVHKIPATDEGLNEMAKKWGIDENGLGARDFSYLACLRKGSMGLSAISRQLGLDEHEVARDIEPYLIQMGLVTTGGTGRQLTEKGINSIGER